MRKLIIAVLMLLSLGAQASTASLGCEPSSLATTACCDPHEQTHCCPSRDLVRLSCDLRCTIDAIDAADAVAVTVQRDEQTPPFDPTGDLPALATQLYVLLAATDFPEPALQLSEPPAARYPSNPTYLATARLRL